MGHYFVDGYNVILQSEVLSKGTLRDQRERLLRFIETTAPQGRAAVTVVFDGRADVSSPGWTGPTRVVYADGEADPLLKRLVDESARPRDVVVVTDDRAIQRWVRGVGAKILSVREFLKGATPRPARSPLLGAQDVDDINDELKRLWKLK